jgi:mannose-6-phosphate isomerase
VLKERIWGGQMLAELFGVATTGAPIGEAWLVSDHPAGRTFDSTGRSLADLAPDRSWFPVLIKVLHAQEDLSVQVHPDDEQAKRVGDLGKTEGWLLLAAEPGARLCYGHLAPSAQALRTAIAAGDIVPQLRYIAAQEGMYVAVPPGTVHALCAGTMVLEVQQASDTTYRLYDYGRTDSSGHPRTLHVPEALEVLREPQPAPPSATPPVWHKMAESTEGRAEKRVLDENPYFIFSEVKLEGTLPLVAGDREALCIIVLDGDVVVETAGSTAGAESSSFQSGGRAFATCVVEPGEHVRVVGKARLGLVTVPL